MPTKPEKPQGKPSVEKENHDESQPDQVGERHGGVKPPPEHDNRGKHYGQREGSTVTGDNDVE